jgi:hypothetical protein
MKKFILIILLGTVLGFTTLSHADLISRGNGLIYDTDLNITWLQDAQYAYTSGYSPTVLMTWADAMTWVASLNYKGITGWRLPTTPLGTLGADISWRGMEGELGHIYYSEGITGWSPGPFYIPGAMGWNENPYWTATTGPNVGGSPTAVRAVFDLNAADYLVSQDQTAMAWAVHDGDVGPTLPLADLEGTWYFHIFADQLTDSGWSGRGNSPDWAYGTMILDSIGAVTGGSIIYGSGLTYELNGGSFTIDSAGQTAGTFTGLSLPHGKLDAGKTILSMVCSDSSDHRGLFVASKGGGTFTQQDLAGTWHYEVYFDNRSTNAPMWAYGTMVVDAGGTVTSGTATNSDGYTDTLVGGSLTINSAGLVSGTVQQENGIVQSFPHGKLDQGKTFLAMENSSENSSTVFRGLFVASKGGGTFTQQDLAGTWHYEVYFDNPTTNAPMWAYGTMVVDAGGTVTSGTATRSDEYIDTLVGGSLTINSAGLVSGTVLQANGTVQSFPQGKLDAGKNFLAMVNSSTSVLRGLFVASKGGTAGTCSGDFASDGDVDGSDLAALIANTSLIDLTTFSQNFGKNVCPQQ